MVVVDATWFFSRWLHQGVQCVRNLLLKTRLGFDSRYNSHFLSHRVPLPDLSSCPPQPPWGGFCWLSFEHRPLAEGLTRHMESSQISLFPCQFRQVPQQRLFLSRSIERHSYANSSKNSFPTPQFGQNMNQADPRTTCPAYSMFRIAGSRIVNVPTGCAFPFCHHIPPSTAMGTRSV